VPGTDGIFTRVEPLLKRVRSRSADLFYGGYSGGEDFLQQHEVFVIVTFMALHGFPIPKPTE